MARRRVPERPSLAAQREATKPASRSARIGTFVSTPEKIELDTLYYWLLRFMPEAAAIEAEQRAAAVAGTRRKTGQKKSRPAAWGMKLAAVEHLRTLSPPIKLSDAPGSICVRELATFVTQWRECHAKPGRVPAPCSVHTAAELAGTLIKMVRDDVTTTIFEQS